jgi:hypothetical protein
VNTAAATAVARPTSLTATVGHKTNVHQLWLLQTAGEGFILVMATSIGEHLMATTGELLKAHQMRLTKPLHLVPAE